MCRSRRAAHQRLRLDGGFAGDVRFEAGIESEKPYPVTSIAFDLAGNMIVAQRGFIQNPADYSAFVEAGPAQVLRLKPENPEKPDTPGLWVQKDPQEYAAGETKEHRTASGGLTLHYAYKSDGTLDTATCNGTIVFSTDAIGAKLASHGLQITGIELVRPDNVPPTRSAFINLNPLLDDAAVRGYAGGVAALQVCDGSGFPPVAGAGGGAPPVASAPVVAAFSKIIPRTLSLVNNGLAGDSDGSVSIQLRRPNRHVIGKILSKTDKMLTAGFGKLSAPAWSNAPS